MSAIAEARDPSTSGPPLLQSEDTFSWGPSMDTSIISKIHKAREYAEDRSRFLFGSFTVQFRGTNADHHVAFDGSDWTCDCSYFDGHSYCAHTMALERLLDGMLPPKQGPAA